MSLEPVWKSHPVVQVSDAGGLLDAEANRIWTWHIKRYQSIQECQARGVRKRFLISGFTQGTIVGAYVGVRSSTARYAAAREPGDSKAFAIKVLANIRIDLDAFSEVEQAVLMNHGYALIDAPVQTGAGVDRDRGGVALFPTFAPPTMTERELRRRVNAGRTAQLRFGVPTHSGDRS